MSDNVEKVSGSRDSPTPEDVDADVPEKRKREYKDFGHEEEGPTRSY